MDNGIRLENFKVVKLSQEVVRMAENSPELLNAVYKEVSEKLGMDTAMKDLQQMTWSINADAELVVEIPLSDVSRKMHIKRIT